MPNPQHTDAPTVVDRAALAGPAGRLRVREKAHTHEGDAIAAARRRLPMVEVDAGSPLIGADGPVRCWTSSRAAGSCRLLPHVARGPARRRAVRGLHLLQRPGRELSYLHARDVTFAMFCEGPYEESAATATSWAGRCPGTRCAGLGRGAAGRARLGAVGRATCATATACSRPTGPTAAGSRRWPHLRAARHDGLRAPGDMGGLAGRLATTLGHRPRYPYGADGRPTAQRPRLAAGYSDDLGGP